MKSSFTAVRRLGIFACAMVAGLAALPTGEARAAQALNYPTLTPPVVYAGVAAQVRVCIRAEYDPALVASSVNLLRVRPDGGKAVVSRMYDDGSHGDIHANDGTFTVLLEVAEPNPAVLTFQVSAGYRGQARRVLSDVFSLEVHAVPNFEEIWNGFVDRLVNRDLDGAMEYMTESARRQYRIVFEKVGLDIVSKDFSSARNMKLKEMRPSRATYMFTAMIDGQDQEGEVVFLSVGTNNDRWLIHAVGF